MNEDTGNGLADVPWTPELVVGLYTFESAMSKPCSLLPGLRTHCPMCKCFDMQLSYGEDVEDVACKEDAEKRRETAVKLLGRQLDSGSKWHMGRHEGVSEMVWRFAGANGCVQRLSAYHAKDGWLSGTDLYQIGCFATCDTVRFRLSARVPPSPHAHARHRGLTRQVRLNARTSALQGGRRPVCW
jgi:hypothetical protein